MISKSRTKKPTPLCVGVSHMPYLLDPEYDGGLAQVLADDRPGLLVRLLGDTGNAFVSPTNVLQVLKCLNSYECLSKSYKCPTSPMNVLRVSYECPTKSYKCDMYSYKSYNKCPTSPTNVLQSPTNVLCT